MDEIRQALEERIAHLTRAVEDLSDVVRDQGERIRRMERTIKALVERELDRDTGGGAPADDQPPPHW